MAGGLLDVLDGKPVKKKTGKAEALAIGAESGFMSIIRGIRQLTKGDSPEDLARQARYKELLADPDVANYFRAGTMAGGLVEPVTTGLMVAAPFTGGSKAAIASGMAGKEMLGKLASSPVMQKILARGAGGAAMGGISGGLAEVLDGESRLGNAAMGAVMGGVATPAVGAVLDRVGSRAAASAATPAPVSAAKAGVKANAVDTMVAKASPDSIPAQDALIQSFPEQVETTLGTKLEDKITKPGFAGNLNLDRFNTTKDVESTMTTLMEGIANKRVPMEDLMMMVKHEGMSADDLLDEFGNFKLSPKVAAAQAITVKAASQLQDMAKNLTQNIDTLSDEDIAKFMVDFGKTQSIHKVTSNMVAEVGRSLRVLQEKPQLFDIETLGRIADANGGRDGIKNLIQMVAKSETPQAVADLASKIDEPGLVDKLSYVWMNNLLSGVPTQVRNIVGNLTTAALHVPEKFTKIALQKSGLAGKLKPGELPATFKGSMPSAAYFMDSIPEAAIAMGKGFLLQMDDKLDFGRPSSPLASPTKLNKALRVAALGELPVRGMSALDGMFKVIAVRTSLREEAAKIASAAKLKGDDFDKEVTRLINFPTSDMIKKAAEFAEVQTFQNKPGTIVEPLMTLLRNHPSMRFIVPFLKTPSNIMKYTLERTPVSLAFKKTRKALANGTQEERAEALSKMIVGGGLTAAAYKYAQNGLITGSGPKDKDEMTAKMATGWRPNSLKIGNSYYPIQGIEPLTTFFTLAADAHELAGKLDKEDVDKILFEAAHMLTRNFTNKTMMMGVNSALTAAIDPQRYGDSFVKRFEGSLVPAWVKNARNLFDDSSREAETFIEVLKDKIPGESETLPLKYDMWGNVMKNQTFGNAYVSPFIRSEVVKDPVINEAARLRISVGKPDKIVSNKKLDAKEMSFLVGYSGKLAHKIMQRNMSLPVWTRLSDEKKKEVFEQAFRNARETARVKLRISNPVAFGASDKIKARPLPEVGGLADLLQR
jgi:hypothetical protein